MRLTTLNSVVLPAPFGPISPTICPSSMSKDSWFSATIPPKRTVMSLTSSRATCVEHPLRIVLGRHRRRRSAGFDVTARSLVTGATVARPNRIRLSDTLSTEWHSVNSGGAAGARRWGWGPTGRWGSTAKPCGGAQPPGQTRPGESCHGRQPLAPKPCGGGAAHEQTTPGASCHPHNRAPQAPAGGVGAPRQEHTGGVGTPPPGNGRVRRHEHAGHASAAPRRSRPARGRGGLSRIAVRQRPPRGGAGATTCDGPSSSTRCARPWGAATAA